MKMPTISLVQWQKRFGTEKACAKTLEKVRWPEGFQCPACGSQKYSFIATRNLYQCSKCRHQVSVTTDTLFHATKVPLVKWFWVIYLMAADQGRISALRLSKHIGISWSSARSILKKIRTAMAHRDSIYRLENLIEFDDTYVGGKRAGKRGRGAEGKRPCFVAMQAVNTVSEITVRPFLSFYLKPGQNIRTDALPALNTVARDHVHEKKVTPPGKASEWLPLVYIMIGNMKKFLNGTFHGVSSNYLQEYLDEFCYHFNRRFWEPESTMKLVTKFSNVFNA
jgi:transposase-like protein